MPKDFDKERAARVTPESDRQCVIGGETFTIRPRVRPEALAAYYTMVNGTTEKLTEEEAIGILHDVVLHLVVPADAEKWERVRMVDTEDAVNLRDMSELIGWAIGVATGRPTEASEPSSGGSQTTPNGTASADESALRAVT